MSDKEAEEALEEEAKLIAFADEMSLEAVEDWRLQKLEDRKRREEAKRRKKAHRDFAIMQKRGLGYNAFEEHFRQKK